MSTNESLSKEELDEKGVVLCLRVLFDQEERSERKTTPKDIIERWDPRGREEEPVVDREPSEWDLH